MLMEPTREPMSRRTIILLTLFFLPLETLQHVANAGDDTKKDICLEKRAKLWKR